MMFLRLIKIIVLYSSRILFIPRDKASKKIKKAITQCLLEKCGEYAHLDV